jgi:hypothetical protein
MQYMIRKALPGVAWDGGGAFWEPADEIGIDCFHARSSSHRPVTRVRALYDSRFIYIRFDVADQYVRCVNTGYQSRVSRDSCVEFFVRPRPDQGYFNFEFNCGGSLLLYYIEDGRRGTGALFEKYAPVPAELGALVDVRTSLPVRVDPEIETPTRWMLSCAIPLRVMEAYVGPLAPGAAGECTGNFFKCGDETSHPHWASWSPIGEELRFHQPQFFSRLLFEA